MDALLGAMALGDIGRHFPDTSDEFKDISSVVLLRKVAETMEEHRYSIVNVDATIVAQQPKMAPHIESMRKIISEVMGCELDQMNIKATTTEKLGFEGAGLGISSQAIVLLKKMEV
jgi:2-C-methyl-D-erythritol 2,4-cyclodiphosphate synthase